MVKIGEDRSERLDITPAQLRVIVVRIRRRPQANWIIRVASA
jgi:transposase